MGTEPLALRVMKRVFWHNIVATLPELMDATGRSRRTILRYLAAVGYHTSYNGTGRRFTLEGIPDFDEDGLWDCRGARFSKQGTLRQTVRHLVESSAAGMTARELREKLHVAVRTRLSEYLAARDIDRAETARGVVYVSACQHRGRRQLLARNGDGKTRVKRCWSPTVPPGVHARSSATR
jgi:hypothetical protein